MKKTMLWITTAALTLSLTACGNTQETEIEATPTAEQSVGVVNPIHSGTAEEVEAATGVLLEPPYGAENVSYCSIDGTPTVAQMDFTLNGNDYTYRIAAASEDMDISGMYYDWAETDTTRLWNSEAALLWNEGETGLIRWYDAEQGQMHSLSLDKNASRELLFNTAAALYIPAQEKYRSSRGNQNGI